MDGFLEKLAGSLYREYGDGVSSLAIVFPNRRSQLFFDEALAAVTGKPLWQPHYMTLDDVMQRLSGLSAGDTVRLVTELYKAYRQFHAESFDSFYFWGELLLGDFDTVDRYMVDARMLFTNLSDLKYLESDLSYLTPEMREVVIRFWKTVGVEAGFSDEKRRFVTIWKSLAAVYDRFRERLEELGIAYGGMLYRRAVEKIEAGTEGVLPRTKYFVVGFNALSACEQRVLDYLHRNYEADFIWDYDDYYLLDPVQEAGRFLRDDMRRLPTETYTGISYDNFLKNKNIRVVAAPSDSLQCKYVNRFLGELTAEQGRHPGRETAVVLLDEGLLPPVLYSLPEGMDDVNVTMGYPLRGTLAYTYVERLIALQEHRRETGGVVLFSRSDMLGIVRHPYISREPGDAAGKEIVKWQRAWIDPRRLNLDARLAGIFVATGSWHEMSDYLLEAVSQAARVNAGDGGEWKLRNEFFAHIDDQLRKLRNSLDECEIELSLEVYMSLVRRVLQSRRLPYSGEPLQGVQIMGILETRNLDFENVVILSLSEDIFPGSRASSSFIPRSLRLAYSLPVAEHDEGVAAYHFYRLLQRARRIDLVYCSRADDKHTGEPSRFIHQLRYEAPHPVTDITLELDANLGAEEPISVEKQGEVISRLSEYTDGGRSISPTALSAFLECRLRFYFRYIARIKPAEDVTGQVDSPVFGSILHRAMELLYTPLVGKCDPQDEIRSLIGSPAVGEAVDRAISEVLFGGEVVDPVQWGGSGVLGREVVCKYIDGCILPFDAARRGFTIMRLEHEVECRFGFRVADGVGRTVVFRGIADRLDRLADGTVMVVDYKTGRTDKVFASPGALFYDPKPGSGAVLQAFLYSMMLTKNGETDVMPSLYFVRELGSPGYTPAIEMAARRGVCQPVENYGDLSAEFEELLAEAVAELFDPSVPFGQCADLRRCVYCDYAPVCRRQG